MKNETTVGKNETAILSKWKLKKHLLHETNSQL